MRARFLAAAAVFACLGCSHTVPSSAGRAEPLRGAAAVDTRLRVGVARVDVTPPPGPSTFGHGPDARVATGYWTRLHCRIFVLAAGGQHVALTSCDLPAISALLHRKVADEAALPELPASRIMIAATHTHAGPAHYFEGGALSGAFSTRQPGFDDEMLRFLATRIAAGIRAAASSLHPARARWVHSELWGLTRNRSLEAFLANDDPPAGVPAAAQRLREDQRAVDPALDVLQLEAVDRERRAATVPLGWIVLFAMHPTVLPNTTRLFGADTHGAASRLLEAHLRRAWSKWADSRACRPFDGSCDQLPGQGPLAAIFNTNEGDISPVWSVGDEPEVIDVGRRLAQGALTAVRSATEPFTDTIQLSVRYLEAHLPGAQLFEADERGARSLCPEGELGNGSGHGGPDHPTSLDSLLPGAQDVDLTRRHCQAPKATLLGGLQRYLIGRAPQSFPVHVSFAVVRLGNTWLSFMPAELTVHAGREVNRRVLEVTGRGQEARVVGLANAYVQYVATPREYELQKYEGASTLYGPSSSRFFAERAWFLARTIRDGTPPAEVPPPEPGVDETPQFKYPLGPRRHRLPLPRDEEPMERTGIRRAETLLCSLGPASEARICFEWTDGPPGQVALVGAPWIGLVRDGDQQRWVAVCDAQPPLSGGEAGCDPQATVDDGGLDFNTRLRDHQGSTWTWMTRFRPSSSEIGTLRQAGPVRVRVRGSRGLPDVLSVPFSMDELPRRCSAEEAIRCSGW